MKRDVNVRTGILIPMCGVEVYQVEHTVLCSIPNENIVQLDVAMDKVA